MGYEKMSVSARSFLQDAARLSYGVGWNEGKSGGSGRIGLLMREDGTLRMIKFNTHWTERWSGSKTQGMIDSSNNLRAKLLEIASGAGITGRKMTDIRKALGLAAGGNVNTSDVLLNRTSVAKVVSLIGGDGVWNDILPGDGGKEEFVSDDDTTFTRLEDRTITSGSAKELGKWGSLNALDFKSMVYEAAEEAQTGAQKAGEGFVPCLKKAIEKAFSPEFNGTLASGNNLGFVNISKIKSSMMDMITFLKSADGPSAEELEKDPDAAVHYLAKQIQMRCLEMVDSLNVGTYGLNRKDIETLKAQKLMPNDIMALMKPSILKNTSLEINATDRLFPEIPPAELKKAVYAASVYTASQLRDLTPGSKEFMTRLRDIKEEIAKGTYRGFVLGVFAAGSKGPADFDRLMRDILSKDPKRMEGWGNLGKIATFSSASDCLMDLYTLYCSSAGKEGGKDWQSFATMVSADDFKFLSKIKQNDECRRKLMTSGVGRILSNAPKEDLITLRESGFDYLNFLMDNPSLDQTFVPLLAGLIRQAQAEGKALDANELKADLDGFWDKVQEKDVLGLKEGVELTEQERKVFRLIASRYPDAALQGDEKKVVDRRNKARSTISETYALVREKAGALAGTLGIDTDKVLGGIFLSARSAKTLSGAICSGTVEKLFQVAEANAESVVYADKTFKKVFSDLVNADPTFNPPDESMFFFGKDGVTMEDAFLDGMFKSGFGDKFKTAIAPRKTAFEKYDKLYNAAVESFHKDPTPENRANLIALGIVRHNIARMDKHLMRSESSQDALYNKVLDVCTRKGGFLNQLEECTGTLKDPAATVQAKALAVRSLMRWFAHTIATEVWFGTDKGSRVFFGAGPQDEIGAEERISGLGSTLDGFLRVDGGLTDFIKQLAQKDPKRFFSTVLDMTGFCTEEPGYLAENVRAGLGTSIGRLEGEMLLAGVKSSNSDITKDDLALLRRYQLDSENWNWHEYVPEGVEKPFEYMQEMIAWTVFNLKNTSEDLRLQAAEMIKQQLNLLKDGKPVSLSAGKGKGEINDRSGSDYQFVPENEALYSNFLLGNSVFPVLPSGKSAEARKIYDRLIGDLKSVGDPDDPAFKGQQPPEEQKKSLLLLLNQFVAKMKELYDGGDVFKAQKNKTYLEGNKNILFYPWGESGTLSQMSLQNHYIERDFENGLYYQFFHFMENVKRKSGDSAFSAELIAQLKKDAYADDLHTEVKGVVWNSNPESPVEGKGKETANISTNTTKKTDTTGKGGGAELKLDEDEINTSDKINTSDNKKPKSDLNLSKDPFSLSGLAVNETLQQHGASLCWFFSAVNGARKTKFGSQQLGSLLSQGGRYVTFYDENGNKEKYDLEDVLLDPNTNVNKVLRPILRGGLDRLSPLEKCALYHAYQMAQRTHSQWRPGDYGFMDVVCKMLGLINVPGPLPGDYEKGGISLYVSTIKEHLEKGDLVTFNIANNHFITITGIDDKGNVEVSDSTDPTHKKDTIQGLLRRWDERREYLLDLKNKGAQVSDESLNVLAQGKKNPLYFMRTPAACKEVAEDIKNQVDTLTVNDLKLALEEQKTDYEVSYEDRLTRNSVDLSDLQDDWLRGKLLIGGLIDGLAGQNGGSNLSLYGYGFKKFLMSDKGLSEIPAWEGRGFDLSKKEGIAKAFADYLINMNYNKKGNDAELKKGAKAAVKTDLQKRGRTIRTVQVDGGKKTKEVVVGPVT